MLQDSLSKFKYVLLLALLLAMPMQAKAGFSGVQFDPIDQTDFGGQRLVYFYDAIDRDTIIQVTNTSQAFVQIHVQVWNATNNCEEVNFTTTLTPNDTNIYDVENLPTGSDLTDTTGFVIISANPGDAILPIIGTFRVIDEAGYEYRTNAADTETFGFDDFADYVLNFNDINGHNLSDVVGITYISLDSMSTFASTEIGTLFGDPFDPFPPLIFDAEEIPVSCSPAIFKCQADGPFSLNKGIDNSLPNTHGYPRICNTSRITEENNAGWLLMPFIAYVCQGTDEFCESAVDGPASAEAQLNQDTEPPIFIPKIGNQPYFVGYLGLNNGDGTGSMDSWWGVSFLDVFIDDGIIGDL